ncbi:hypothetical protein CXG81DRAFT_24441 [Caulochytrium protostelioides]|uniref:Orc1-like AAA ATPase domain-containing protein n=1 Tax=Caulochytrium protostelioides TaxID=1555241 RepID=A0A4P9XBX9_9FUNG|nr:hypothetical protein CXG81DRAFT_24441 [Caulochytrium protostelioides]|eukprot:RKP02944.1 hypothetical protein CXG81DRAFT_24441 [Caulochytrium protostelioides]
MDAPSDAMLPSAAATAAGPATPPPPCDLFPGREAEINTLTQLAQLPAPKTIFVTGPPASGKTAVCRAVFPEPRHPHVDAARLHVPRLLFESTLDALVGHTLTAENGYAPAYRCETMADWIFLLGRLHAENRLMPGASGASEPQRFIVVDNAHLLRNFPDVLTPLLRASGREALPLSLVFVTHLPWSRFMAFSPDVTPLIVPFTAYTAEQRLAIMARDCPPGEDPEFYTWFLHILHDVFCVPCTDLNELRYLASLLFPQLQACIASGAATREPSDRPKLFRHLGACQHAAGERLWTRELSRTEWAQLAPAATGAAEMAAPVSTGRRLLPLPYDTKFLLLAAYLASANPPKLDAHFYTRSGPEDGARPRALTGRGRGRGRGSRGGRGRGGTDAARGAGDHAAVAAAAAAAASTLAQMAPHARGPRAFPLERLLAIFHAIVPARGTKRGVAGGVRSSAGAVSTHAQVALLIALRLLLRAGGGGGGTGPGAAVGGAALRLDDVRLKCNVPYELAREVSASVSFDLDIYLVDG